MLIVYWNCLIFGIAFAVISLVIGDIIGHWLDSAASALHLNHFDFMQPIVLVGGITAFGAAGIIFHTYTMLGVALIALLAILIAIVLSVLTYIFFVKNMNKAEHSIGHSVGELIGRTAEVSVTIPAIGYGEILIRTNSGVSNYPAVSFEGLEISQGQKVVIVELRGRDFAVSELNI
ncbi:NfeD family protein [Paenibacillus sp. N3.4]|uniref:NfeD family protein n=1 Tax=Paenibacillus sp. N3.4 TaxID=2603222 RepID=UPI0011CB1321|nr:NfeD family protein [Paenibacillus sp. N3.4]TXK84386.1 protease [Paenibacillus sp. N3.4]